MMKIEFRPEQVAWLKAQVSAGMFANEQAAFDAMFPVEHDVWVKPYLDEALAEVDAANIIPWSASTLRSELRAKHPELNRDPN